jgi:hypothetical protein
MAKKGGRRGGSSAARSAAAKKGWETRRRGGAKATGKAKPATKPAANRGGMPKTTSARGRALTNQRRAADLVRAGRGGKGPSAKAVRSVLTAQKARAFYAATGGGTKRSARKTVSSAKVGRQIRAEGRAKAKTARAAVAGRPKARVVAKPASKVVPRNQRRQVAMRLKAKSSVKVPKNRLFGYFMQKAQVPTKSIDWGSRSRKQGKRIGGGMVIGGMSAAPVGIRIRPDYSRARGLTRTARNEISIMPDEHKKVVIGAMQRGWRTNRALRFAFSHL